jgi:two-component system, sensor histidine kinase LadS
LSRPELGVLLQRRLWPGAWCCLCLALFGLLLLTQPPALAQTPLQSVSQPQIQTTTLAPKVLTPKLSLYVDPTRLMEVQDVSRQVFTPFKLLLNRSAEATTRWLKIEVQVPADQTSQLMLAVGPYFLSELELYHEEGGRWVKQLGGAKHPSAELNCSLGHHCLTLSDSGGSQRVYFLRIHTINGFYVSTQILAASSLVDETISKSLRYGVQIGIFLTLIGWSAIYLIRFRTLLVGWFCLTQITALFLYCFSNGLTLREFISESPELYAPILSIAFCLRLMLATCLCLELLRRWQARPWFQYYCLFWLSFWVVQIGLIVFSEIKPYLLMLNWLFLFTAPFFLAAGMYQSQQLTGRSRLYWTTGALTVGVLMCADAAFLLSDTGIALLTLIPGTGASMLVAVALYLLLLGYSKMQQEQWLQTMFELNTLKAQTDYEQRQLKERSTLIDMLSHELKNPLATMRMALGSLKSIFGKSEQAVEFGERFTSMTQSIDNMTQVIDRVGQVDAIDQKNFVLRYEKCAVLEVIESLPLIAAQSERFRILGLREVNIQTDRLLLMTIINNLIDNAVKYSPPATMIEVSVSTLATTNKLLCIVSNEVERNHEPDPNALFTRYYRSIYSHDKPGTGLGLVLIKSLCEILKGSVSYRFEYNRVFFSVELPL